MSPVNITSDVKPLKQVLLHRPGKELLNLTPSNLENLLFDDIPDLKKARLEHDAFAQKLKENGVEVVYLEDLMTEVLTKKPDIKQKFINQFIDEANIPTSNDKTIIFNYLNSLKDNKTLVLKTMEGIRKSELNQKTEKNTLLITDPMPNLYFTRDNFSIISSGVSLNKMYSLTRNRETIYGEYIFKYHPKFNKVPKYYDRYNDYHIEGGDILNLNENILAVGISQRTEFKAILTLAHNIFNSKQNKIKTILAINIPYSRAAMHLDTVLTEVDYDKFVYYKGIINSLKVYAISKEKNNLKVKKLNMTLKEILEKYLNTKITLIPCGGNDEIDGAREQWSDGSNTLCIAPGTIIAYNRNHKTNALLRKNGIKVIEINSSELSKGRGGPRCMSMPLIREK